MKLRVGTSGYSYKQWKGTFYPDDLAAADMLQFYATKLPAVEINNTFYRLPKTSVLENWAQQVPDDFRFAIKASRRITHMKRLKGAEDERLNWSGLAQTPTHGTLDGHSEDWILTLLRRCVTAGWVDFRGGQRPVVVVTPEGQDVIHERRAARLLLPPIRSARTPVMARPERNGRPSWANLAPTN